MGFALVFTLALASSGAPAATPDPGLASALQPIDTTGPIAPLTPDATLWRAAERLRRQEPAGAIPRPAGPTQADPAASASSVVQAPSPIASSWSAPPAPVPQAPAPPPEPAAVRLARETAERFGIRIVLEGQDWGPDEVSQEVNIGAVISAMERLPQRVASSVVSHPHGALTFLSNRQGRTLDGWQPYGDFPIGFYTNSDQGPAGSGPANQVVLIPGFADLSIGHEVLHAYQFRNVGSDQYVLALLGEEMRSFVAATGWRQVGSDEQVRAAVDDPWDVVNGLYAYEGRPLTYAMAAGSLVALNPTNPLEAFAVAGSIYYTRPAGMPLPDWPEYWAWFQANLG